MFRLYYAAPMGFGTHQLREKALAALEEAAANSRNAPVERSKAIAFALAYLWAFSGKDRAPFTWFWQSLASENDVGRSQNVRASLNAIYRAVGLPRT